MTKNFSTRTATSSIALAAVSAFLLSGVTMGCTSKNYVRAQTAPIVQNINGLDAKTAADHNAIASTDERAQAGINGAMSAADRANQHSLAAGTAAEGAQQSATEAANHVDSLAGVVANLDQYKPLADLSVTFQFDKATLTAADKAQLDSFAANLTSARGYILQVTGGTDAVGNADYNYRLSQRRADAVVQYLSVKYQVPPHKFYLVGIGKDQQVASDKTAAGRARNRRVEIQLLSNTINSTSALTSGAVQ
jgi:outer membrane protein OmpA-like peptidoglycan-associated protein